MQASAQTEINVNGVDPGTGTQPEPRTGGGLDIAELAARAAQDVVNARALWQQCQRDAAAAERDYIRCQGIADLLRGLAEQGYTIGGGT